MLLPGNSPWLTIQHGSDQSGEQSDDILFALFADERIPFLPRDVTVLPLRNITVEELAGWALQRVLDAPEVQSLPIRKMLVRVASGNDQWARADWSAQDNG